MNNNIHANGKKIKRFFHRLNMCLPIWSQLSTEVEQRVGCFAFMVIGVLVQQFWIVGWTYLNDPSQPLSFGSPMEIVVRVLLSFCVAGVTFFPAYQKIKRTEHETWVILALAFQSGFFWPLALSSLAGQF